MKDYLDIWANKTAITIKNANPSETSSVEEMHGQLGSLFNLVAFFVLTCLFGWMFGHLQESLKAMWYFVLLRSVSNGFHLNSLTICAIITAGIFVITPFATFEQMTVPFTALSLIICLWKAPTKSKVKRNIYLYKGISCMIVVTNFYIQSPIAATSFLVQSLLLLPGRRR